MPFALISDADGLQGALRLSAGGDSLSLLYLGRGSSMSPSNIRGAWNTERTHMTLEGGGPSRDYHRVSVHAEELTFRGGDGTGRAATFARPDREGRHPVVLLLNGSGPSARGMLLTYSAMFAASGVATLVYDKRGTGHSEGRYEGDRLGDLAEDARNALAVLRGRADVDTARIGILGQSQGAWVAMMVAAEDPGVHFIVTTSGGAFPIEQEIFRRVRVVADSGLGVAEQERARAYLTTLFAYYASGGRDSSGVSAAWRSAQLERWGRLVEGPSRDPLAAPMSAAWRAFGEDLGRDWPSIYRRVRVPVYALNSAEDPNVPADLSRQTYARYLPRGRGQLTFRQLHGDHGFNLRRSDGTTSLDAEFFPTLLGWLKTATKT